MYGISSDFLEDSSWGVLLTAGVFGLGFELDELKRNPFLNPPNVDG
jgi:hypothetical protein